MATAAFGHIDDSKVTKQQWLIVFISGMGFFTDAYDLFVIGVAVKLITKEWHLAPFDVSLLNAAALGSAAIGSIVFGRVADLFGRKLLYGFEVLVLAAGAIASSFAPSFWWLFAFRFVLGLGIGGDYPVSATIASEYSGSGNRGRLIGLVFTMQAAGLIVGPLVAIALLANHVSEDLTWRILLGVGAIPPLAVFWMRRHLAETPRFQKAMEDASGGKEAAQGGKEHMKKMDSNFKKYFTDPTLRKWLIGASLSWFVLDVAYYGNTITSPLILKALQPNASQMQDLLATLAIFVLAALPGYLGAVAGMDVLGRKRIQWVGFVMMAVTYCALAIIPGGQQNLWPFLALFGINYFFVEFGPNTTTFVFPAEIFPSRVRTTSHGIAATVGKVGATIGAFTFPLLLARFSVPGPMVVATICSVIGAILTIALLPEPKGMSLEDASRDDLLHAPEGAAA